MSRFLGKIFDQEAAEKLLPLVRSIVKDLVNDFNEAFALGKIMRGLQDKDPFHNGELLEKSSLLKGKIEGEIEELMRLGVEIRDLEKGAVAFSTIIDGRPVSLSWKLGEEKISFWHEVETPYRRIPLPEPAVRST